MKCVFMWCLLVCRFSEARSEAIHGGRVTDIHVLPSMRHVCHGAGDSLSLCQFYDCSWFCVCECRIIVRASVYMAAFLERLSV